jgi:hypothetical protein
MVVKVFIWKEREHGQKLHNRFVLTELVGVEFGTGLDEEEDKDADCKDNVSILPAAQRNELWIQYGSECPAFLPAVSPLEIIGSA